MTKILWNYDKNIVGIDNENMTKTWRNKMKIWRNLMNIWWNIWWKYNTNMIKISSEYDENVM